MVENPSSDPLWTLCRHYLESPLLEQGNSHLLQNLFIKNKKLKKMKVKKYYNPMQHSQIWHEPNKTLRIPI